MKAVASFALTLFALASAIVLPGCGGGNTATIFPSNVTVTVSGGLPSVQAGGTAVFTATVTGDSAGKGVTWSVSCSAAQCGSIAAGPASGVAGQFNGTYTAPAAPPPSDLAVTVKAVSVADGSKSGTAPITVSAITISFNINGTGITASTPTTATVQVGAGNFVDMTLSLGNDPANAGATFTLSPASQASNLLVNNPFDAQYNAPTTPPASDLTVTMTATSITDPTKTVTLTITVPSVTISLSSNPAPDANGNVNVEATGTVAITPTVGNDPSGKGVTWAVTCSSAACGSMPAGPTLSGAAQTYTAPGTPPPSDLQITVTAISAADPAAQASINNIFVKAISVSVAAVAPPTPPSTTVLFGQTQDIAATVTYDPANKGVTWAISCDAADCGSISSNASGSGQPITYKAPANPPASDVHVTIVATSDSDPNQTGSIAITVPAITVSVGICSDQNCAATWPSAIIPVGATAALNSTPSVATVGNDSSTQVNVNWTLTQNGTACPPAVCGTVAPTTTASGTATIYAAPSSVPANASVTITATSATDNTKSASATITLVAGVVKLIPAALDFGNLKIAPNRPRPTQTLPETLTNTGASALSITGETITGTNASLFTVNAGQTTCSASAASGASCVVAVTFAPTAVGSFSATLSIADSDTSSPQQIPLSGKAHTFCFPGRCPPFGEFRSALARNQMPAVPSPTGSSRVGTRTVDLVDVKRSDPYLGNGARRELLVRFWYPANVGRDCQLAQYTSPGVLNYLANLMKVPAPQVKTNSCQNAPVASGAHPVVVFTHGFTGTFTDYTFLFEDLASRGYVVASVNHTLEATATAFPDGRLVKSVIGTHFEDELNLSADSISQAVAVRLADLKFVMDELGRLNASRTGPLAGRLDMRRVALAGHSLGGMTALLGLKLDARFHTAISIDGVLPGPLFGSTQKPVLMLISGHDVDQDACRLWTGLHGARLALNFKGSEHLTPSDAVWLAPGAVKTGTAGIGGTVAAIRDYIAAFLDTNLKGNAKDQLLTGPSVDHPDVQVTTQTQSLCGSLQTNVQK